MTQGFWGTLFVGLFVTVDNALLAGFLLPRHFKLDKRKIMTVVGIGLGISQIVLASFVGKLLDNAPFRLLAIVVLIGMTIWVLQVGLSWRPSVKMWTVAARVCVYTVIGNLDNMILLGSKLKGQSVMLAVLSIVMIPLFVIVATFLANQVERHRWILILGAGMMAWAAAGLTTEFLQPYAIGFASRYLSTSQRRRT